MKLIRNEIMTAVNAIKENRKHYEDQAKVFSTIYTQDRATREKLFIIQ